jgi:hypothetical protein
MTTEAAFSERILQEAARLKETGLDPNQIAGLLCKSDPDGCNYGIGIILDAQGKPAATSPTLLDAVREEVAQSGKGIYQNSDALMKDMTEAVLRWQGVPEHLWSRFRLLLPSDAGTGAVQTALQIVSLWDEAADTLAVEELGWPAYKALARTARLRWAEYPSDGVPASSTAIPLYQAGPMNTTGRVPSSDTVHERVRHALAHKRSVVLDRAYSGFEFARRLGASAYADLMKESFRSQVLPFAEEGVPFCLAISPTKAFVTFALRPCGMLLAHMPEEAFAKKTGPLLTGALRARGSSFEHPVTRAFVKTMVRQREKLEQEHAAAMRRLADAEMLWSRLTRGTALARYFTDDYAGLFRNLIASPEAPRELYGAHLYPVFSEGRCRLNITGLPADEETAADHVRRLAAHCR